MVAIAVDRYLCICHPWRSAQLMNQSRAKLVVTSLALFAALIGICVALMYGVYRPIYMPHDFQNLTDAELTAIVQNADKYVTITITTATATASGVVAKGELILSLPKFWIVGISFFCRKIFVYLELKPAFWGKYKGKVTMLSFYSRIAAVCCRKIATFSPAHDAADHPDHYYYYYTMPCPNKVLFNRYTKLIIDNVVNSRDI